MPEVHVIVNGSEYAGWTEASVVRGVEAISNSFRIAVSAPPRKPLNRSPLRAEDECRIELVESDDSLYRGHRTLAITGFIDRVSYNLDKQQHNLEITGRDKAGLLVDCSAVLKDWQFFNIGVLEFCRTLAKPFDINVTLQDGVADAAISTAPQPKSGKPRIETPTRVGSVGKTTSGKMAQLNVPFAVNPGESAFDAINRACTMVGLLPVSDGEGGIVLTRGAGGRATSAIVEGTNVLSVSGEHDASRQYSQYIVNGFGSGSFTDETPPPMIGKADDRSVRRTARKLIVFYNGNATLSIVQRRAEWESAVRYARARPVEVVLQGWRQSDASLWPVNALVRTTLPSVGIDDAEMLITEATYSMSVTGGSTTRVRLALPSAFLPEPVITSDESGAGLPADVRKVLA
jgi:prophage tail gpP-like protein